MKNKISPVIVIGMHRSGTTMLSKFIEESGVFMGKKNQMGPNGEAFFFQRINEWLLFQKGANWDSTNNLKFQSKFTDDNLVKVIKKRISNNFHTKSFLHYNDFFSNGNLLNCNIKWGFKDPKTTLLLDIWSKVLPNAKIIHIYRNPIDVANSLLQREQKLENEFKRNWRIKKREYRLTKRPNYNQSVRITNIKEGVKLWEEYIKYSLNSEKYFNNVIHIGYENFLSNPEVTLHRLSDYLDLEINDKIIDSITSKVNPKRAYAFKSDDQLVNLYDSLKDRPLLKKLNYINL